MEEQKQIHVDARKLQQLHLIQSVVTVRQLDNGDFIVFSVDGEYMTQSLRIRKGTELTALTLAAVVSAVIEQMNDIHSERTARTECPTEA